MNRFVSAVVLTYNSEDYIDECLRSLKNELSNSFKKYEVIVIDNHSSDSTFKKVLKDKEVSSIKNKYNEGFAKGINRGIKYAKGDLILIVNPDTKLLKNSLKYLYQCMKNSASEIAGGMSFKRDGSTHGSFVRKPNLLTLLFDYSNLRKIMPWDIVHKRHYYIYDGKPTRHKYVDVVSGSFMMIEKKVIEMIGNFDEHFFMYLEDVDFCVRAREMGIRISLCPKSKIFHEGGASSENQDKIFHRAWNDSRKFYARKHFGIVANLIVQPVFEIDNLLTTIWRKLKSR